MTEPTSRCGFIAILGAPNVGKSTLLNQFVGLKVSIVTPKVQTARTRILGICLQEQCSTHLYRHSGDFVPRRRLDRAMVAAAWGGAGDADHVILVADVSRGMDLNTRAIIERLREKGGRGDLILNKIDLVDKTKLLALATEFSKTGLFEEIFMVSAERGDGVADVLGHLTTKMQSGPWLFPGDQVSDMPDRILAAEVTREKLFLQLHKELPYAVPSRQNLGKNRQTAAPEFSRLFMFTGTAKRLFYLEKKATVLNPSVQDARMDLEEMLGHRVHLFLFVKVREKMGR